MKTPKILVGLFILGIFGTPTISGQGILIPLGRQISHYNLLQRGVSQLEFQQIQRKISYFEDVIKYFAEQYGSIIKEVLALTDLVKAGNGTDPVCPKAATAIGAKMVNGKCLSIEVSPMFANDAKIKCMTQGGILAEPLYTDANFLTNLSTTFPDKVIQASPNGMWIGIESVFPPNPPFSYWYKSNGALISDNNPIWAFPPPHSVLNSSNAFIVNPYFPSPTIPPPVAATYSPGTWRLTALPGSDSPRSFICQYASA